MAIINRNITEASNKHYDLIVIGGGIHGVMLALEASIRNVKTLLVEQYDFGGQTSYNSLRILHGGFRYLQNMDLQRLYESANERRWYLEYFPEYASPLACLMPLYGLGLRRSAFLRPALKAYNLLTARRNKRLQQGRHVPNGGLLRKEETLEKCKYIREKKLQGAALWYDGFIPDSQRILIGALRWGCEYGLDALNYVRAVDLLTEKGKTTGILAHDDETDTDLELRGNTVVNAAGPWCRDIARNIDRDEPSLFRSMMAWNVLFKRPAISTHAIAASPPGPSAHTYFIIPWKGMMFAGTGHAPWHSNEKNPQPTKEQLKVFCSELNRALPGINLNQKEILHVFAGLQSAKKEGGTKFTKREVIIKHSENGGPDGFFSISGIKFTTSRKVAEKSIQKIFPETANGKRSRCHRNCPPPDDATKSVGVYPFDWVPVKGETEWIDSILKIAKDEAVVHLGDLVVRRTSLGDNPTRAMAVAKPICDSMHWSEQKTKAEIERLRKHFNSIATLNED